MVQILVAELLIWTTLRSEQVAVVDLDLQDVVVSVAEEDEVASVEEDEAALVVLVDEEADVVEQGGGFVSCRSPVFSPPLDLSGQAAFELELHGDGRHYKLAVACADGVAGLTELLPGGVRWVANFATATDGPCRLRIPFDQLRPSIRAKPIDALPMGLPLRFDPARITRLQILHSKFGDDGSANPGFRAGPLLLELMAIDAVA
jgi:hypothetical protein